VAAEDVRNLQHEMLQGMGLSRRQAVQWTGDFMQQVGGHLHIKCGVLKLGVAEQNLDHADIHLLFEKMRRKTVAPMSLGR
jgi:hypothetical protein